MRIRAIAACFTSLYREANSAERDRRLAGPAGRHARVQARRESGGMRWPLLGHLTVAAIGLGLIQPASAPAQIRNEYQVKAAVLLNFARFIEWPTESFQGPADPFVTCVLGRDPFGHWLHEAVEGRWINGRRVTLRHISKVDEAASCKIVFVAASESRRTWAMLSQTRPVGVLTVGECDDASEAGAIISLRLEADHVRFDVNVQAAEIARIKISSRLLSLARNVRK